MGSQQNERNLDLIYRFRVIVQADMPNQLDDQLILPLVGVNEL